MFVYNTQIKEENEMKTTMMDDRVEEGMPPYTMKELDERILRSTESYHDGKYITAEDMSLKNFLK